MFIIQVLPLAKKNTKETLSYISPEKIESGSRVFVPIRNKTVPAMVLDSLSAQDLKSEIKNLDFSLKKIPLQKKTDKLFRKEIIELAKKISPYYAKPEGSIISSLTSKTFLFQDTKNKPDDFKIRKKNETFAIQGVQKQRNEIIKSIIRESFAKKESVALFCSTKQNQSILAEEIKKGIEKYVIIFDGGSAKKIDKFIEETKKHPMVVCGNLEMLSLLPGSIGAIIIEEESSRFHKAEQFPYLDKRFVIKEFAKIIGAKVFLSDTILSLEAQQEIKEQKIQEYGQTTKKIHSSTKVLGVDMRTNGSKQEEKKVFRVISEELREMLLYATNKKKKLFVFCARRGLSSQTICMDCGEIVKCLKCNAPVVLHKNPRSEELNNFICHHCAEKRSALETCKRCGSWRLNSIGVGIEKVVEEIELITKKNVLIFDQDRVKSQTVGKKIIKDFLENKEKDILVGTESALNLLSPDSMEYSAIAAFDSLFSLPDFRLNERIIHLIIKVKNLATECFLLQGRNMDNPIVEYGLSGEINKFIQNDLKEREVLSYPPFKTLIKISIKESRLKVDETLSNIAPLLLPWKPIIFPAFIKTQQGDALSHILLKIDKNAWPDEKLRKILSSLPPFVSVKVDPESLL